MDWYLEQERRDLGHRVDPEVILALGEQAAKRHVQEGQDLTSAVLDVIEQKALNPAHVCRIVETANQRAYLLLYEMMPGPQRLVTFKGGPARIFEVLRRVFESSPAEEPERRKVAMDQSKRTLDYALPPGVDLGSKPTVKVANLTEDDVLPGRMTLEKMAKLMGKECSSPGGRMQLFHMLKGASEEVHQDLDALKVTFERKIHELIGLAKEASGAGYSPADIARVMMSDLDALPNDRSDRLVLVHGVMHKIGADLDVRSIPWGKAAAVGHPISKTAQELLSVISEMEKKNERVKEIDGCLESVRKEVSR